MNFEEMQDDELIEVQYMNYHEHYHEQLRNIDLEEAKVEISNSVYEATSLFEFLENAGKIRGNGHHMQQRIALFAAELMEERWIE